MLLLYEKTSFKVLYIIQCCLHHLGIYLSCQLRLRRFLHHFSILTTLSLLAILHYYRQLETLTVVGQQYYCEFYPSQLHISLR